MSNIIPDVINVFPSIYKYEYTNTVCYEYIELILEEDITKEHMYSIMDYISNKYTELIFSISSNMIPTKSILISIPK